MGAADQLPDLLFSCAGNCDRIGNQRFPFTVIFLRRKMIKKTLTEKDLRVYLKKQVPFPPFRVEQVHIETSSLGAKVLHLDAILTLGWKNRHYRFGVEARRLWTPKIILEAIDTVRRHVSLGEEGMLGQRANEPLYPLILVPYLNEEWLLKLEDKGISGLDLCGNGLIVVPGEVLVLRTGFPNRYRWESTIKNVYRKNSSIAARTFLLVPSFHSVKQLLEEIRKRQGHLTLPTVSKVCKSLEDDLIIERRKAAARPDTVPSVDPLPQPALRLTQAEKLLDLLADNYVPPVSGRTFRGKCALPPQELQKQLATWQEKTGARIVLTGTSSVDAYAVMAREPVQSFYCSDLEGILNSLEIRETDRFANIELMETSDDLVYFDRRPNLVASPIQSYVELMNGDKRERETAGQVRRVILDPLLGRK